MQDNLGQNNEGEIAKKSRRTASMDVSSKVFIPAKRGSST